MSAYTWLLTLYSVVMQPGTFVCFQPRQAAFQKDLGDGVSEALEAALHTHSALSEGDWLSLAHGGQRYDLRVLDLRPSPCVSVIGAARISFHSESQACSACCLGVAPHCGRLVHMVVNPVSMNHMHCAEASIPPRHVEAI